MPARRNSAIFAKAPLLAVFFGTSAVVACSLVTGVDFNDAVRDGTVPATSSSASGGTIPTPTPTGTHPAIEPTGPITPVSQNDAGTIDAGVDSSAPPKPDAGPVLPPCYPDADGDGLPGSSTPITTAASCPVGSTSRIAPLDCDDRDPNARVGQTNFFITPRVSGGWDYDCDGKITWVSTNAGGEQRTTAADECSGINNRDACENAVKANIDVTTCGQQINVSVCRWFAVTCGKSLALDTLRISCR